MNHTIISWDELNQMKIKDALTITNWLYKHCFGFQCLEVQWMTSLLRVDFQNPSVGNEVSVLSSTPTMYRI